MNNSKEYNKANYLRFWGNPKAIKARSIRNKARAIMIKKGKIKEGSPMEIDHKNGTAKGNGAGNLRVISRLRNRIDGQKKSIKARNKNNS